MESIAAAVMAIAFMLIGDRADNKVGQIAFYVIACGFIFMACVAYTTEFSGLGV